MAAADLKAVAAKLEVAKQAALGAGSRLTPGEATDVLQAAAAKLEELKSFTLSPEGRSPRSSVDVDASSKGIVGHYRTESKQLVPKGRVGPRWRGIEGSKAGNK